MLDRTTDTRIRSAAFTWLSEQVALHGDVLPREILAEGFILDGTRVPLVGPQGIFKPRLLRGAAFDHHSSGRPVRRRLRIGRPAAVLLPRREPESPGQPRSPPRRCGTCLSLDLTRRTSTSQVKRMFGMGRDCERTRLHPDQAD